MPPWLLFCTFYQLPCVLRSSYEKFLKISWINPKSAGERSFHFAAPTVWNSLSAFVTSLISCNVRLIWKCICSVKLFLIHSFVCFSCSCVLWILQKILCLKSMINYYYYYWLCSACGPRGGHSHIMELLMLVNQPQKWTLNGVIGKGWFATLNGVTLHISNPKWRNEPKSYPKWRIGQNLTLNGVLTNILYKRCNKIRHHRCHWQHHQHHHHCYHCQQLSIIVITAITVIITDIIIITINITNIIIITDITIIIVNIIVITVIIANIIFIIAIIPIIIISPPWLNTNTLEFIYFYLKNKQKTNKQTYDLFSLPM